MPTGYTAGIGDGKITTLEQYAWTCAQAFGALVSMRDDAHDAQIPEQLAVGQYYIDSAKESTEAFERFKSMSQDELEAENQKEMAEALAYYEKRIAENKALAKRYSSMLDDVLAWTPPTEDFVQFKDFMTEQILTSQRCDLYEVTPPVIVPFKEWLSSKQEKLARSASYSFKNLEEETARVSKRNKWISQLRESLKP